MHMMINKTRWADDNADTLYFFSIEFLRSRRSRSLFLREQNSHARKQSVLLFFLSPEFKLPYKHWTETEFYHPNIDIMLIISI